MFNIDITVQPNYFYVLEILLLIQCIFTIFYISKEMSPFFFFLNIPLTLYNLYGLASIALTTNDIHFKYVIVYFYGGIYLAMIFLFSNQLICNVCNNSLQLEDDEYEYIEEYEEYDEDNEEREDDEYEYEYEYVEEDDDYLETSPHTSSVNYFGDKFDGIN